MSSQSTALLTELTVLLTHAFIENPEERAKGAALSPIGERVIELLFTIFSAEMHTFGKALAQDIYDYKDAISATWLSVIEGAKWQAYNSNHKIAQHKTAQRLTSARSWFRTVYKSLMIDYHRRELKKIDREYPLEKFAEENEEEDF